MAETVMIRVRSHRASDKLKRIVGDESLQWYFNVYEGSNFVSIPAHHLEEARKIPGITLARPQHALMKCWSLDA